MKKVIIFGGVLGVAIAALMMFFGASHNPQGEFTNDPLYLLAVGLSWALPIWLVTALTAFAIRFFVKKQTERN